MNKHLPDALPPRAPQFAQTAPRRFFRWLLGVCGWKLVGEIPNVPKVIAIVAPHSSWWDGWWALMFMVAMGFKVSFIAKNELFVGPLGWLLRKLGGLATDRNVANGTIGQLSAEFASRDQFWVALAPEGTRKKVQKWKSGFWHLARATHVPIVMVSLHYPDKTLGFGPLLETTDDLDADMARIRAYYVPFQGKHRGTV